MDTITAVKYICPSKALHMCKVDILIKETHLNILYKNYESKARFEAHLKSLNTTNM